MALRKDEFFIGEEFHVDITCENTRCKYQLTYIVTEIVKRSSFKLDLTEAEIKHLKKN
jgi:hypothetical protein